MASEDKHVAIKELNDEISANNLAGVIKWVNNHGDLVDAADEHGMTPLQHACYRGNTKMVQLFLDHGANVNWDEHENQYSALHFAAISGNSEICYLLLMYGAKPLTLNSVGKTPAQMAAFVGNHSFVAVINNFINKSVVDYYTEIHGLEKEPKLLPILAEPLHQFISGGYVHPVKVALSLKQQPRLLDNLDQVANVLELMSENEMKQEMGVKEVMSFKLHYYKCIIAELARLQKNNHPVDDAKKSDPIEAFIKKMLRPNRSGDTIDQKTFLIDSVRSFHARECATFRQLVTMLTMPEAPSPAFVISQAINGITGFPDTETECWTCGEKGASKKCSKCKEVRYCDRECQRLHWFVHKKMCDRPTTTSDGPPFVNQETIQAALASKLSPLSID